MKIKNTLIIIDLILLTFIIYLSPKYIPENDQTFFSFQEQPEEEKKDQEKVVIKNQNEEEYIPFLDNEKIQISLLFITTFAFYFFSSYPSKRIFKHNYQIFWFNLTKKIKKLYYYSLKKTILQILVVFFNR